MEGLCQGSVLVYTLPWLFLLLVSFATLFTSCVPMALLSMSFLLLSSPVDLFVLFMPFVPE